jgi:AraC-like DNA-binding protein
MSAEVFVNPQMKHAILVEPKRIVGRTLRSAFVNIEAERPISRLLGGYVVYFSSDLPFAIDRGRGWEREHKLVLVFPYQPHRLLRCEGLRSVLIEPESVCPNFMADDRWIEGTPTNRAWTERIEQGFKEWARLGTVPERTVDELIFGCNLPARALDPRVSYVVEAIAGCPSGPEAQAVTLARQTGLSTSRLSHLFREQLNIPIRSFRAWKRVRNSMALTANEPVLINAALDAGYADEPHYSRSMRKYFGQHAHLMQRHWRHAMTFRAPATSHA